MLFGCCDTSSDWTIEDFEKKKKGLKKKVINLRIGQK